MAELANQLRSTRLQAGLSLREAARRAGTSHATFRAYELGNKSPSLRTLERLFAACNAAVDLKVSHRIRAYNGLPRGVELEQALELAAQFPSRHKAKNTPLCFPRFPQRDD